MDPARPGDVVAEMGAYGVDLRSPHAHFAEENLCTPHARGVVFVGWGLGLGLPVLLGKARKTQPQITSKSAGRLHFSTLIFAINFDRSPSLGQQPVDSGDHYIETHICLRYITDTLISGIRSTTLHRIDSETIFCVTHVVF